MKITQLQIHNIGIISDTTIEIDKPLLLFYGDLRQGKSTILKAFLWCLGGSFPQDIIRHGQEEAHVEIALAGGCIRREFYVAKDGTTKARELTYVLAGKPVKNPASEIKRLLNPFLLDQDYLLRMGEADRKRFFTELFAVDTSELDTEAFNKAREAEQLRAKIKGYGDIDLTPVARVDVDALEQARQKIFADASARAELIKSKILKVESEHKVLVSRIEAENRETLLHNAERATKAAHIKGLEKEIDETLKKVEELQIQRAAAMDWMMHKGPRAERIVPETPEQVATLQEEYRKASSPDTGELMKRIGDGRVQNVKAQQFEANQARAAARKKDEERLSELEWRQRGIKAEKAAKLKGVTESCGIPDLAFDEEGNFSFEGTAAGMLSTSQIMKLSSSLSGLYPEGLGVELLDRAESLGKSIFEFVERAKREEKTILATIVGERPAKVPPEIGVFVVEQGKVTYDHPETI